jgi:2-hydroxy-3-keto-5-methylthiopentenyl-1-phosphate phosphatase
MSLEAAYLIDFDGTITTRDITTELALFYGGSAFMEIEKSYRAKEIPIRLWLKAVAALLPGDLERLQHKTLEWAQIRPGFKLLLEQARSLKKQVVVASDGLGFYIEPILKKYGLLEQIDFIYRNDTFQNKNGRLEVKNPHAHPTCRVCGNCKAAIVVSLKESGRPVIYIGDGSNDRFGASWSDHIFAREELAESCVKYNLEYSPWIDFYDIINTEDPILSERGDLSLCCPKGNGIKN